MFLRSVPPFEAGVFSARNGEGDGASVLNLRGVQRKIVCRAFARLGVLRLSVPERPPARHGWNYCEQSVARRENRGCANIDNAASFGEKKCRSVHRRGTGGITVSSLSLGGKTAGTRTLTMRQASGQRNGEIPTGAARAFSARTMGPVKNFFNFEIPRPLLMVRFGLRPTKHSQFPQSVRAKARSRDTRPTS